MWQVELVGKSRMCVIRSPKAQSRSRRSALELHARHVRHPRAQEMPNAEQMEVGGNPYRSDCAACICMQRGLACT
eukprot:609084-Alexandrium_andersonii.AAC.1